MVRTEEWRRQKWEEVGGLGKEGGEEGSEYILGLDWGSERLSSEVSYCSAAIWYSGGARCDAGNTYRTVIWMKAIMVAISLYIKK